MESRLFSLRPTSILISGASSGSTQLRIAAVGTACQCSVAPKEWRQGFGSCTNSKYTSNTFESYIEHGQKIPKVLVRDLVGVLCCALLVSDVISGFIVSFLGTQLCL